MDNRVVLRALLVLGGWVAVLGVAGYVAGQQWVPSLGADLMAMIGAWVGAIGGLVHVLLIAFKTRHYL